MQKYLPLLLLCLTTPVTADVLTPYRSSSIYVQSSYPTYPFPSNPTLAQYQIASNSADSSFGADIQKNIAPPTRPTTADASAEAAAQYASVHAYTTAITDNSGPDPIYGAASATAAFGDGFTVQNGPASGIASFSIVFEGNLVNSSALSFESSTFTGAYAELEATLVQNFVGGSTLFDVTIQPGRLTQNTTLGTGVTVTFASAFSSGNTLQYIYNARFPYQTNKDYFLSLSLTTSADKNGTADFLNTGAITNFQADPAATSISFDSGTPSSVFAPEPATLFTLTPALLLLKKRRPAHFTSLTAPTRSLRA